MRNILIVLLICFSLKGFSQELNCNVVVNALQTGNENLQIFKTLEKQLNEFVNNTKWTNENYAPEPGFYYGAMFISYIITAFFCLGFVGILILGFDWSINGSFALLVFVITICFVWIFRISRSLWINAVIHYDKNHKILKK